MPITAEYQWEETNAAVSVLVPLRGAKPSTSDVFVAGEYVKINSMPYFLELDLHASIISSKSRAVFEPQGLRLFLPKQSAGKWGMLCTDIDKEERIKRREASIEARCSRRAPTAVLTMLMCCRHEELRQAKVDEKREKVDDDKAALKRSMDLEVHLSH